MTSHSDQVKHDIKGRYDNVGQNVLAWLDGVRDSAEVWRAVEGARPPLAYFRQRKIEAALALGRFPRGGTIVEVGCGTGDYALLLARMGFQVIGVDLSLTSIEGAKRKAQVLGMSEVSFVASDAETLHGLTADSVDGVVSFSALRYVPNIEMALEAIRRVLKPGAAAVLDFPNRYCPWFTLLKNRFGVETHIHDHHYSTKEIVTLLCRSGFHSVEARRILFTSYIVPTTLLPLFKLVDRIGERTPVFNLTAGIIMAKGTKL
jgi:ubiquinone/menaquinone biosynthesis C-methylase UbiE